MKSALISLSLQSKFDGLSGNLWVGPMEETLLHNQEVDPEDRASFFFLAYVPGEQLSLHKIGASFAFGIQFIFINIRCSVVLVCALF